MLAVGTVLGKGSYGKVTVNNHPQYGRCALKKVRNKDRSMLGRLDHLAFSQFEIRALERMSACEYVVNVYNYNISRDDMVIFMELCDTTLFKVLQENKCHGQVADNIAIQLIRAVSCMSDMKVAHLDLKPANVGVQESTSFVKILDFGLAETCLPLGAIYDGEKVTHAYKSPELCEANLLCRAQEKDPVTTDTNPYMHDLWSLACILCEVTSGRHPFMAVKLEDVVIRMARALGRPPPSLVSHIVDDFTREPLQLPNNWISEIVYLHLDWLPHRRVSISEMMKQADLRVIKPCVINSGELWDEQSPRKRLCASR
jgi:serine/threonine protein kinase